MRAPEFWAQGGLLPLLLSPLGLGYGLAGRLRRAMVRPAEVPVPVICVGNLVAGGAGKTPVTLALCQILSAQGRQVHVLSRGYGGNEAGPLRVDPARHSAATVGDEALLLAKVAPTWIARDRVAGAQAAIAANAEVIVMDDGFQNPSLAKDLSLLVVDGAYGFGNVKVMPAGPLRETVTAGLARADALVVLGEDEGDLGAEMEGRLPVLHARLAPGPERAVLMGRKLFAFAGIGRPEKFFKTLTDLGADLVETKALPDHYAYRADEIEALLARAAELEARPITTEKDAVRLTPEARARIEVLSVSVEWQDSMALQRLLDRVCPVTATAAHENGPA